MYVATTIVLIILLFIVLAILTAKPQCPHNFNKWKPHLTDWQRRECQICGLQEEKRISG